jgi:subtilisin family serine protease
MRKRMLWTVGIVFFGVILAWLGIGLAQQRTNAVIAFQEIFQNKNLRPGVDYVPNEILVSLRRDVVAKIGINKITKRLIPRIKSLGLYLSGIDYAGLFAQQRPKATRVCGGVILTLGSTGDIATFPVDRLDEALRQVIREFYAGAEDDFIIAPNDGHHMPEGTTEIPSDPDTMTFRWDAQFPGGDAKGVKVAVLDSGFVEIPGVLYDQPNGRDFSPGDPTSGNPRDWRVDNIEFIPRNGQPHVYGHGTPVVETLVRIAHNATILPIKVCNSFRCTGRSVAQGLCWASDKEARVINLSLGGFIASPLVEAAVRDAVHAGAVVVAAAGNTRTLTWSPNEFEESRSERTWNAPVYPAAWSQGAREFNVDNPKDGIISVTAMSKLNGTILGWVSPFGYVGPTIDVMTYGERVFTEFSLASLWRVDVPFQSAERNGTSISAPIIAGAAAVLIANNPRITPVQVKARIISAGLRFPLICYKTSARYEYARNGCTSGRDGFAPRPIAADNEQAALVYLLDESRLSTLLR